MEEIGQPIHTESNSSLCHARRPDVLRYFDIRSSHVHEYFQLNNIDTLSKVNRTEKDVSLARILAIFEDRRAEWKTSNDTATSVIEDDLNKATNK